MATEEEKENNKKNPYGEGLGTGGKFRKRPFRRTQTTPYDRPPNSLRNPTAAAQRNNEGWFYKLIRDPAQRFIFQSANSLFSSIFRKRLPPPPPPPPPPPTNPPSHPSSSKDTETEQVLRDNHQEAPFVGNNLSGKQYVAHHESDVQIICSDGESLSELEKLLRQKTFTRSEVDRLTALMRSRTEDAPDAPTQEGEERKKDIAMEPRLPCEPKEEYPKTLPLDNVDKHLAVTPYATSSVPIEDVASPAELAKAYMGSRPSKVSAAMLGVRSTARRDDLTFPKSENFSLSSSVTSIVPRTTRHAAVHENGFVTPRSRGRSAIYSMARTPYSRPYVTSTLKGGRLAVDGEPSSSTQSALDRGMLSGSIPGALKRSSLTLDNDIGSVGPIRRVRQKSNLLYSKGSSSLSIARSGAGGDYSQQPSSSSQNPTLIDENVNDSKPSTSFPALPTKSSEMASKILQQLDKLVSPKEKSSESRLSTVNDISPMKLSPSMLRGQALRSMETVDSSKLLENMQDNKLDGKVGNLFPGAQKLTLQKDTVENGPLKLNAPSDVDATNPKNQFMSSAKSVDSSMINSVSFHPQKKSAFHMSAQEDFLDLDDDAYPNGAVSSSPAAEKETSGSIAMAEKTTPLTGSKNLAVDGEGYVGAAATRVGEKVDISTSITPSIPGPNNPVTVGITAATKISFGSEKPASPNGSVANPAVFNFASNVVSSTATGAPADNLTKSAPIFGLEKVPQVPPFSSSSPGEGFSPVKFGASDSTAGNFVSTATVAGTTDSMPKVRESEKGGTETNKDMGFSVRSSGPAVSPVTSTSPTSIFTFGQSSTSSQNNGSIALSPPMSSPFSSLGSNNFASQNIFSSSSLAASSTSTSNAFASAGSIMTTSAAAMTASNNCSSSTPLVSSSTSSSTASIFKFGSTPSLSTGFPVSSSGTEPLETKRIKDGGVGNLSSSAFSSSSAAVGSTGSGIFGVSSSSNSQSQGSVLGATVSSGSILGAQVSPDNSQFAVSTQSQPLSFGSSASTPSFGLAGSTTSSGSSLFTSSSAGTTSTGFTSGSLFGSSGSSPSFGLTGSAGSSGSSLFTSSTPATGTAFPSVGSFGSSAAIPSFGLTESTASSGSSFFTSSSAATNSSFSSGGSLFSSTSPATNIFNSGSTFGLGASASSSAANSNSSNGGTSTGLFGSSTWQPNNSPFGSTFSSSSSAGFSFGASAVSAASSSSPFGASTGSVMSTSSPSMFLSTNNASTPQFSFTSAAASTSSQNAFGTPNPVFSFGSTPVNNNDQMSMEDSMAEDTVQATPPGSAAPIFSQQPPPAQSNFVFGASTPSGASPFQFGQNTAPQSPSPFQASGSQEFNAGGSFSLGTGGGDKAGRRMVRVKNKMRKK